MPDTVKICYQKKVKGIIKLIIIFYNQNIIVIFRIIYIGGTHKSIVSSVPSIIAQAGKAKRGKFRTMTLLIQS